MTADVISTGFRLFLIPPALISPPARIMRRSVQTENITMQCDQSMQSTGVINNMFLRDVTYRFQKRFAVFKTASFSNLRK